MRLFRCKNETCRAWILLLDETHNNATMRYCSVPCKISQKNRRYKRQANPSFRATRKRYNTRHNADWVYIWNGVSYVAVSIKESA